MSRADGGSRGAVAPADTWRSASRDMLATAVLTSLLLATALRESLGLLGNPLGGGDQLAVYTANAFTWGRGHPGSTTSVGFPFGMDLRYFPSLDIVQDSIAGLVVALSGNPFLGVNLVWLLSFPLTALAAWWVLRLVETPRLLAVTLAVAYTFIPYHWLRGIGHTYLATMWSAALGVGLAILVGTGRHGRSRRERVAVAALCVAIAWSGIYYAFFALVLVAVALTWRLVQGASWRVVTRGVVPALLVAAAALVALLPSLLHNLTDPPSDRIAERLPTESATYAGNLAFAISPSPRTDVPILSKMVNRLEPYVAAAPVQEGNGLSQFGTVVTTASILVFIVGLAGLRRRARSSSRPSTDTGEPRPAPLLASMLAVSVLLFVPWSLNLVFAAVVSPQIRAWNRLLPIILLLCVAGAGAVLRELGLPRTRLRGAVVAAAVLAVTVVDTVTPYAPVVNAALSSGSDRRIEAERYARAVNGVQPGRCGILQLPYVAFPESPPVVALNDYEHFLVAVTNPAKSWSYGAVKNTEASTWARNLSGTLTPQRLRALASLGFCGVHVDTRGFTSADAAALQAEVQAALGPVRATGLDGQWQFTPVPWSARSRVDVTRPRTLSGEARILLYPPRVTVRAGASDIETGPTGFWYWTTERAARFQIAAHRPGPAFSELTMAIATADCGPRTATVTLRSGQLASSVTRALEPGEESVVSLTVPHGSTREATLLVSSGQPGCRLPGESRNLVVQVRDLVASAP